MKTLKTIFAGAIMLSFAFAWVAPVPVLAAATAPDLGAAATFAVLGGASVANTGATVLNGDLGISPGSSITGFFGTVENDGPGVFTGYAVHQTDGVAAQAQSDATTAYNNLSQACDFGPVGPTDLAAAILTPGVYCYSSSVQISVGGGPPSRCKWQSESCVDLS